jgi:hypothetical protein
MKKIPLWLIIGIIFAIIHIAFFQYSMVAFNNGVQVYNKEVSENGGVHGTYNPSYLGLMPLAILDYPTILVAHHIIFIPPYFSIATPHFFDVYLGSGNIFSDIIILILGTIQWFLIGALFSSLIYWIYKKIKKIS